MEHIQPLQRTNTSVSVASTISVGTSVTCQIATMGSVEIANLSTTDSAAFRFTPLGASTATQATVADRTIPPATVLTENLPAGASFASAIAIGSSSVTVVFTPVQA